MITKTYNKLQKFVFCPNCHRQIKVDVDFGSIKVTGKINLNCGTCKKGQITIKEQETAKKNE